MPPVPTIFQVPKRSAGGLTAVILPRVWMTTNPLEPPASNQVGVPAGRMCKKHSLKRGVCWKILLQWEPVGVLLRINTEKCCDRIVKKKKKKCTEAPDKEWGWCCHCACPRPVLGIPPVSHFYKPVLSASYLSVCRVWAVQEGLLNAHFLFHCTDHFHPCLASGKNA